MSSTDVTVSPKRAMLMETQRRKACNNLRSIHLDAVKDPELTALLMQLKLQAQNLQKLPPQRDNDCRYWLFRQTFIILLNYDRPPATVRSRRVYNLMVARAEALQDLMPRK